MIRVLPLLLLASPTMAQPTVTAAAFVGKDAVVVGSQAGVRLLSWPDLKPLKSIATRLTHVHDLSFSPAGDLLALAGGSPGEKGTIELIRWPSLERVTDLAGHEDVVHAVAWSADGKRLVSASADGSCQVFDVTSGKSVCTFKGHVGSVLATAWLPDGKQVLSAGVDQSLRLWDAATGKLIRVMENHTRPVNALAIRPAMAADELSVFASAGSDRTVRLWQPTIGRMMKFKRLPAAVLSVAWSGDGKQLLAGCADGTLRAIDPDSIDLLKEKKLLDGWVATLAVIGQEGLVGGEKGKLVRFVPASSARAR